MKISIIGTGDVGGSLGTAFAARGHNIVFGTRDPDNPRVHDLLVAIGTSQERGRARVSSINEAVKFSQVVIFAIPANAIEDTINSARNWEGRIIVDATNRFGKPPEGTRGSVAEDIAALVPEAHVVKAFNTLGANLMGDPHIGGERASMFICGDNDDAKATLRPLIAELGFDVVDVGKLDQARLLESLAQLWVALAGRMGRNIAFKLLRE